MPDVKEKKSFKKFATNHLATAIENRRKGRKIKKEKIERVENKRKREERAAQKEERDHVAQLDRLKETDPEFYSYLEEEDPNLLQFGQENMEVVDEVEGSDVETEADEGEAAERDAEVEGEDTEVPVEVKTAVTRKDVDSVSSKITPGKYGRAVALFVSASWALGVKSGKSRAEMPAYFVQRFNDPSLVPHTLVAVGKALGASVSTVLAKSDGTPSFTTPKHRMFTKQYMACLLSILNESPNTEILPHLLHATAPFVPVFHLLRGMTKQVLRAALNLCAHPDESVRLPAYMLVRTIATRSAGSRTMYQSTAFKGIFLALVRSAHTYNVHTLPIVSFLMNCVVDLYGTDMEAAYQHAFAYIRQLAVYLRAALQEQSQHNIRTVFNWQYINALRTWGLVVSTYSAPHQLWPLIHPIVQVALGVMDLFSSPRMFPMHLHVIEMLNHISARAGVYIPLSSYILRILTSPAITIDSHASKKDKADAEAIDIQFSLRVRKNQSKSVAYHVNVWLESLYVLADHLALQSHRIGFPEAFWAVSSTLSKLRREVKHPRVHSQISTLLRHMECTSQAVKKKRDNVNFGPCDINAVKAFEDDLKAHHPSPLVAYHKSLRSTRVEHFAAKQNVASKRVTLEDALRDGNKKPRGKHNGGKPAKKARTE